jgi:replication-associated recombination protein RarA
MFAGPTGCGKTTPGRIVAASLQCSHQKLWGEPCDACLNPITGMLSAVLEINAASENGVEELGRTAELARYQPAPPAKQRVIILDECHVMSANAQTLILKVTEEPPKTTTWIMCTTDPAKLKPTLRDRFVPYQVKQLGISDVEELLTRAAKQAGITRSLTELFEQLHNHQIAGPRALLVALEKYASGVTAEEAAASTDTVSANTLAICRAMTGGKSVEVRKLLQGVSPDEARWVRASVGGWLRSCFFRERDPRKLKLYSDSMLLIADGRAPFDDQNLHLWTIAKVYEIAKKFGLQQ